MIALLCLVFACVEEKKETLKRKRTWPFSPSISFMSFVRVPQVFLFGDSITRSHFVWSIVDGVPSLLPILRGVSTW